MNTHTVSSYNWLSDIVSYYKLVCNVNSMPFIFKLLVLQLSGGYHWDRQFSRTLTSANSIQISIK